MTNGMKKICNKIVAVLEGGYDLKALEISTEAVVRTLQLTSGDQEGFDNLIANLSDTPGLTLSQLEMGSMMNVREQFKQTASNLAKLLKKQWPFLADLICEKSKKRKGSSDSNSSNASGGFQSLGALSSSKDGIELKQRTMSMQD